jgi:hypothetical protein
MHPAAVSQSKFIKTLVGSLYNEIIQLYFRCQVSGLRHAVAAAAVQAGVSIDQAEKSLQMLNTDT